VSLAVEISYALHGTPHRKGALDPNRIIETGDLDAIQIADIDELLGE
jgi:hypothetical protein